MYTYLYLYIYISIYIYASLAEKLFVEVRTPYIPAHILTDKQKFIYDYIFMYICIHTV